MSAKRCLGCNAEITQFTALDGTQPAEPRPGDPLICDCGLVQTMDAAGTVRLFTAAEEASMRQRATELIKTRADA